MSLIQMTNIYKTYQMGARSLTATRNISLSIHAGEELCLAGSSGSGKSTLLNLIGCIDTPSKGQYIFNGVHTHQLNDRKLTALRESQISFIFQSFHLIPVLSVFENVEYPLLLRTGFSRQERRERVEYYLNKVGLYEHRKHRPSLAHVAHAALELGGVAHDRQHVQRVEKRQRDAAPLVLAAGLPRGI